MKSFQLYPTAFCQASKSLQVLVGGAQTWSENQQAFKIKVATSSALFQVLWRHSLWEQKSRFGTQKQTMRPR